MHIVQLFDMVKCCNFLTYPSQHREFQPVKSGMVKNTSGNTSHPTIVEWPSACPKRKFVGRGQGVIRDLPKRKKRNRKKGPITYDVCRKWGSLTQ